MTYLLELGDNECRWLVARVDGQHWFCAAPTAVPGVPYCHTQPKENENERYDLQT